MCSPKIISDIEFTGKRPTGNDYPDFRLLTKDELNALDAGGSIDEVIVAMREAIDCLPRPSHWVLMIKPGTIGYNDWLSVTTYWGA